MQKLHDDLFNKGFHKLNDSELFKYLTEIDSWEWNNLKTEGLQLVKRNSFIEEAIDKTHKLIADKYIKLLDTSYKFGDECDIVNGMDDATLSWHNDNIEGYNLCVLLYIDSMDEDIGGMTRFRDIQSKEITGEFYPQKYDVSFMNHGSQFEHIVTPMKLPIDRRVALFNYNISGSLIE